MGIENLEPLVTEWWVTYRGAGVRAGELSRLRAAELISPKDAGLRTRAIAIGKVITAAVGQTVGAWRIDRGPCANPSMPGVYYRLELVGVEPEAACLPPLLEAAAEPPAPSVEIALPVGPVPATRASRRREALVLAQGNALLAQRKVRRMFAALERLEADSPGLIVDQIRASAATMSAFETATAAMIKAFRLNPVDKTPRRVKNVGPREVRFVRSEPRPAEVDAPAIPEPPPPPSVTEDLSGYSGEPERLDVPHEAEDVESIIDEIITIDPA